MPKRLCPFETMFSPQLKAHISEKEVNLNSQGKSQMENIHAKTLQKLFLGAKNSPQKAACTCGHQTKDDHRYKQLRLGSQGQLVTEATGAEVQESGPSDTPDIPRCTFCDVSLPCQPCQRVCQRCHAVFCQQCCLNVFTDTEDTSLCLSCVR